MGSDKWIWLCDTITIKLQNISFIPKISLTAPLQSRPSPQAQPFTITNLFCATIILPFLKCYINGRKQYVVICICLHSHSTMLLRFTHAGLYISSSLNFNHWVVFNCENKQNMLIHSQFGGHLDCFQLWASMKQSAMNIYIHGPILSLPSGKNLIADCWVIWKCVINYIKSNTLFSKMAIPFCIPIPNVWKSQLLGILVNIDCLSLLNLAFLVLISGILMGDGLSLV